MFWMGMWMGGWVWVCDGLVWMGVMGKSKSEKYGRFD